MCSHERQSSFPPYCSGVLTYRSAQSAQFGLVVSILTMGGLVGALSSDLVTRRFGRIGTLRISAAIIFFGSAAVGLANTFTAMLVGRYVYDSFSPIPEAICAHLVTFRSALIGYGCGLSTVSVPLYLSEIAPPRYKRSLGIMNQFAIVTGMLIAQSLSFPWAKELVWRLVLVVSMGVAVLQLVGSLFMRETRGDLGIEAAVGGDEETPLIAVGMFGVVMRWVLVLMGEQPKKSR